jgi:short-subunit dehydrogenase
MKIFRFNTNVETFACEQKIAESFNKQPKIISFKVDLNDPKRPMEVSTTDSVTEAEILSLINAAGYEAAPQDHSTTSSFR